MEKFVIFSDITFQGSYFPESEDVEWSLDGNSLTDIRCWLMEITDRLVKHLSTVEEYEEQYFGIFELFVSEHDISEYVIERDEYERA